MNLIFSIKDLATEAYGPPFHVRAQGEAVRMFMDECNNPESRINKHPADFELYKIGTYDDLKGALTGQTPERVSRATDYKAE